MPFKRRHHELTPKLIYESYDPDYPHTPKPRKRETLAGYARRVHEAYRLGQFNDLLYVYVVDEASKVFISDRPYGYFTQEMEGAQRALKDMLFKINTTLLRALQSARSVPPH